MCKLDDKKESNGGVWNMRFVDIVSSNLIDNKLEVIATELGSDGNEVVVVLNDEMIELGCEKWKSTVCGFLWEDMLHIMRLGKPIIIDDMTAKMCAKDEGRLSFARVLIEIDDRKELKKEIEVEGKKVNVELNEDVMMNVEKPFTVVHNNRVNFTKDNQNKNKWNGNNGYNGINANGRKKQDTTKGSTSDSDNRDEIHKSQNEEVVSPKEKRTENINRGNENYVEKSLGKESVNDAGNCSYNRFTLLNELVGEKELIPTDAQKDRKELSDAAKNMEQNKDVECDIHKEEEFGKRNEEKVFGNWEFSSNEEDNNKGCRIMVGWNPNKLRVWIISKTKQCMFLLVETVCKKVRFFCTMVYASNSYTERRKLWKDLGSQKIITNGEPWVTLGDFNVTLKVEEHSNWSSIPSNEMDEFAECLRDTKLDDILSSEKSFFRFFNFVTDKKEFLAIVKKAWEVEIERHMMYRVVKKLKLMKPCMNKLSWKDGNIFERVTKLIVCLKNILAEVDKYPHNVDIKVKSCKILSENYKAMKDENNLLMQKAKIEWLKDGDRNTEFFHKIIKGRMHKGRIVFVCNEKGERFENDQVVEQFVKYFQEFLGKKDVVTEMPKDIIVFLNKLSFEKSVKMCKDVSDAEVKNAMFDIKDSKAPRPDGNTARFYKSAWSVIGKDICQAVKDFFVNGKLLGKDFLRVVLEQFGFPKKMVKWIMVCVSTTKFSVNINEEREGYFSGGRGLRQGDHMLPYLFTLVMEAFNLIMRRNITDNKEFNIFHGDKKSVIVIKKALEEFNSYSGLKANMSKSTVFFGGLTEAEQKGILDIFPFAIGRLPVRYLGVLLLTKKIIATACKPLVEKVKDKIYWVSLFLLLKNVIYEINKLLKGFLWCQGELTRGKAKLWSVIAKKDTLWVNWINTEYLKGKSVWVFSAKASSSAGWNEMLKLRDKVRKHILWKVGDGVWYNNWCSISPICDIVTTREIYEASLNIDTTVNELVNKYEGTKQFGWIGMVRKTCLVSDAHGLLSVSLSFSWKEIVEELKRLPNNQNVWSIVRRLMFGTVVYYTWQERNNRLFRIEKRDERTLIQTIKETVQLKIAGFVVKESRAVREIEDR
nr:hypothetical protein [Tanacetum cinerariifolium]